MQKTSKREADSPVVRCTCNASKSLSVVRYTCNAISNQWRRGCAAVQSVMRKYHRLKDYDYSSPGKYAITLKCVDGIPPMSKLNENKTGTAADIELSTVGEAVRKAIEGLPEHYDATIDVYAIMPDHLHIMLTLGEDKSGDHGKKTYLGRIVASLKSFSTRYYGQKVFIDDYYDIVCYSDERYEKNYDYILSNPAVWIAKHERKDL